MSQQDKNVNGAITPEITDQFLWLCGREDTDALLAAHARLWLPRLVEEFEALQKKSMGLQKELDVRTTQLFGVSTDLVETRKINNDFAERLQPLEPKARQLFSIATAADNFMHHFADSMFNEDDSPKMMEGIEALRMALVRAGFGGEKLEGLQLVDDVHADEKSPYMTVAQFVHDCCVIAPAHAAPEVKLPAADAYNAYKVFAASEGLRAICLQDFVNYMKMRFPVLPGQFAFFLGLLLKSEVPTVDWISAICVNWKCGICNAVWGECVHTKAQKEEMYGRRVQEGVVSV